MKDVDFTSGKTCPKCGGVLKTVDSRKPADPAILVRRRMKCASCAERFTTHEIIVAEGSTASMTMNIVAAHDKACAALSDTLLNGLTPDEIGSARNSLAVLRRFA